ncbi:hypothetical protein [Brevundimonas lutea]|uniref:hypothetical protein n=1 Tax=Brevundimonas lutea TaxID=2293980 RepID=UPI0013CEDACB|nr:hypothetical protein [Brevundimonas lutea]
MTSPSSREDFRDWVNGLPLPAWPVMPLTHITKAFVAQDIVRKGMIEPNEVGPLGIPLAYMFYGRPGYRVSGDGAIKVAAACPICFIFDPDTLKSAELIHGFDTGAFGKRLYSHVLLDEMSVDDFRLGPDLDDANRIISALFKSRASYFDGDTTKIGEPNDYAPDWNFLAQAYIQLLASKGRNEPDDRLGSIEIAFSDAVALSKSLKAIIVPHSIWDGTDNAPWLNELDGTGIEVIPYKFTPGKSPEHYFTLIESEVRALFKDWGHL